jgi:hypothetical protein
MYVYIKLNNITGIDTENFSLYSINNVNTETLLVTGILRSVLVTEGYTLTNVPEDAIIIRAKSNSNSCTNYEDIPIIGI